MNARHSISFRSSQSSRSSSARSNGPSRLQRTRCCGGATVEIGSIWRKPSRRTVSRTPPAEPSSSCVRTAMRRASARLTTVDFTGFVLAHLPPAPARVLEVGCGSAGGVVPALAALGYEVLGVDPDAPEGEWYVRARFQELEPGGWDAVVAGRVLHHVWPLAEGLDRLAAFAPLLLVDEFARTGSTRRRRTGTRRSTVCSRRRASAPPGPPSLDEWRQRHPDLHPHGVAARRAARALRGADARVGAVPPPLARRAGERGARGGPLAAGAFPRSAGAGPDCDADRPARVGCSAVARRRPNPWMSVGEVVVWVLFAALLFPVGFAGWAVGHYTTLGGGKSPAAKTVTVTGRSPRPDGDDRPRRRPARPRRPAAPDDGLRGRGRGPGEGEGHLHRVGLRRPATRSSPPARPGTVGPNLDTAPAADAKKAGHGARRVPAPVDRRPERVHSLGLRGGPDARELRPARCRSRSSDDLVAFVASGAKSSA